MINNCNLILSANILLFLILLMSGRLCWSFFCLGKNIKNEKTKLLATFLSIKSFFISLLSLILGIVNIVLFHLFPLEVDLKIASCINFIIIFLLFIGTSFLYWLIEIKNGIK